MANAVVDLTAESPDLEDDLEIISVNTTPVEQIRRSSDVEIISSSTIPSAHRRAYARPDMPFVDARGTRDVSPPHYHPPRRFHRVARPANRGNWPGLQQFFDLPIFARRQTLFPEDAGFDSESTNPVDQDHFDMWRPFEDSNSPFPQPRSVEQATLERVLAHSIYDTSNHQPVDADKIKKPVMTQLSEGCTRSLAEAKQLICARCPNKLGPVEGADEQARKVYVRNCGHVYCGKCVLDIRNSSNPRQKRCDIKNCSKTAKRRPVKYYQVYF